MLCRIFLYTQHREILKQFYPLRYEEQISEYAGEEDLDPYLVMAVIRTESSLIPRPSHRQVPVV